LRAKSRLQPKGRSADRSRFHLTPEPDQPALAIQSGTAAPGSHRNRVATLVSQVVVRSVIPARLAAIWRYFERKAAATETGLGDAAFAIIPFSAGDGSNRQPWL
jgi:hypothetical protein